MEECVENYLSTYDGYLKSSLLAYPTIFATAHTVDDHIFCTIGNGLKWDGGIIKSACDNEPMVWAAKILLCGHGLRPRSIYGIESVHRSYPLSKYSLIMNVPENVKPDWLEAAINHMKYLTEVEGLITIGSTLSNQEQRNKAREILDELKKRM